jgi:hypothetical protein
MYSAPQQQRWFMLAGPSGGLVGEGDQAVDMYIVLASTQCAHSIQCAVFGA